MNSCGAADRAVRLERAKAQCEEAETLQRSDISICSERSSQSEFGHKEKGRKRERRLRAKPVTSDLISKVLP